MAITRNFRCSRAREIIPLQRTNSLLRTRNRRLNVLLAQAQHDVIQASIDSMIATIQYNETKEKLLKYEVKQVIDDLVDIIKDSEVKQTETISNNKEINSNIIENIKTNKKVRSLEQI
jgi:hypothetical protein